MKKVILQLRRPIMLGILLLINVPQLLASPLPPLPEQPKNTPWPTEIWQEESLGPSTLNQQLDETIEKFFSYQQPETAMPDTRALLIVKSGKIVKERYAPGYNKTTKSHVWSVSKSITHTLAGVLVAQGKLTLEDIVTIPPYKLPVTADQPIRVKHLLQMSAGLKNSDDLRLESANRSFLTDMLYQTGRRDIVAYASEVEAIHPPGTHWAYSTAVTSLVGAVIASKVGNTRRAMLSFMRESLFDKLGMKSVTPTFDAAGNLVSGAYFYASARDLARLGLLYLRDGQWDGERLLPQGWVDFSRTPNNIDNNKIYGAHFWLNGLPTAEQRESLGFGERMFTGGAESGFTAWGFRGQYIALFPEQDLIIVRQGEIHDSDYKILGGLIGELSAIFSGMQDT